MEFGNMQEVGRQAEDAPAKFAMKLQTVGSGSEAGVLIPTPDGGTAQIMAKCLVFIHASNPGAPALVFKSSNVQPCMNVVCHYLGISPIDLSDNSRDVSLCRADTKYAVQMDPILECIKGQGTGHDAITLGHPLFPISHNTGLGSASVGDQYQSMYNQHAAAVASMAGDAFPIQNVFQIRGKSIDRANGFHVFRSWPE